MSDIDKTKTSVSVVDELVQQRDRLLGKDGWCWTDGHPRFEKECCAIYYRETRFGQTVRLSEDACIEIALATRDHFKISPEEFSLVYFNDYDKRCSAEVLVKIYDGVIEELSSVANTEVSL